MTNKKRAIAVIVAAAILLVVIFSSVFIAAEADHDCVGENCPICCQIAVCKGILKILSAAVYISVFAIFVSYIFRERAAAFVPFSDSRTLVSLKIKLSD